MCSRPSNGADDQSRFGDQNDLTGLQFTNIIYKFHIHPYGAFPQPLSSQSRMKKVEKSKRQNRLCHCPSIDQGTDVIWVFQERVWDCICNQRRQARHENRRRTSSVVARAIFDQGHVPESKKNGDQWRDTGSLIPGVLALKEEKVKRKRDPRCGVQSEVDSKW